MIKDDLGMCERCGSYTNLLDDVSLMSRGKALATWTLCQGCRDVTRIEDLLELIAKELHELRSSSAS